MNTSHSANHQFRGLRGRGDFDSSRCVPHGLALCGTTHAHTAAQLLAQAQKLYDQGNRYQASPLFAKAEQEFRKARDKRDELFAKFGRLHADADHGNYRSVKAELERDLAMPLVQRDPELKIEALSVLGTIDLNIDTNAAGAVWKEVLNTAIASHDLKWENRARGELGIFAGLSGNIGAAGAALFKAIATAERLGDIGGAVNFMVWLANGMALNGMADGALRELDNATELARANGYHQLPFELSIARLRAIAMLPEPLRLKRIREAKRLLRPRCGLPSWRKSSARELIS